MLDFGKTVDAFAGCGDLVDQMAEAYERLSVARVAIDALAGDAESIEDRIDYLRFQLDELDAAAPVPGEDAELARQRARLQSMDQLQTGARTAEALAYSGDDAAVDRLAGAASALDRLGEIDASLEEPRRQLEEARSLAEEAAASLRDYVGARSR